MHAPQVVIVLSLVLVAGLGAAEKSATVQDFESDFEVNRWGDAPGEVAFSSEWKSDGKRSLRIDPGLMSALDALSLKDWSSYTHLRVHVHNPGTQTIAIGLELQDQHGTFHERHQNGFGVQPGDSTIEIGISGGLWRGEENRPYRGKIKTPIEIAHISRMSFINNGGSPVFIDQIEVVAVPPIACPGAFAFDFAKRGAQVMGQFIGIDQGLRYSAQSGYGLLSDGIGPFLGAMSYPTPMLGAGFALPAEGFQVDLPGGKYLGLIAFERGGFWGGDERCSYDKARVLVDGVVAHEHDFTASGQFFLFEDTEITDGAQIVDKLIWPAHAIHRFGFAARAGANVVRTETVNGVFLPLRVAGLIIAPDNAEGERFMQAHIELQRKTIATTFAVQDRGRRGDDRVAPGKDLQWQAMVAGEQGSPRDWPRKDAPTKLATLYAVPGQRLAVQLAVFARKEAKLDISASALAGPSPIPAPAIAHGRYLPNRPYGTGAVWLEIHHFRPEPTCAIGPDLSRAVLIDVDVPADAKPGAYTGSITLRAGATKIEVPIAMTVVAATLPTLPIPVGMFMNAVPFTATDLGDEAAWWRLQESLLREQCRAGLTAVSGGDGLGFELVGDALVGDAARRYLRLAKDLGVLAAVSYGGFLPGGKYFNGDWAAFAAATTKVEAEIGMPQYCYMYDEPGTDDEKRAVLERLAAGTGAGLRTIGYTSAHFGDPLWEEMMRASYAPALNGHTADGLAQVKAAGRHPWVYNNGSDRFGFGLGLWRQMRYGIEGRMEWIGTFVQGFAFHNLDGREPSDCKFHLHRTYGMLPTPGWISARAGLLDTRIRLALEAAVTADDAALQAWPDRDAADAAPWTDERMQAARVTMLERLAKAKR